MLYAATASSTFWSNRLSSSPKYSVPMRRCISDLTGCPATADAVDAPLLQKLLGRVDEYLHQPVRPGPGGCAVAAALAADDGPHKLRSQRPLPCILRDQTVVPVDPRFGVSVVSSTASGETPAIRQKHNRHGSGGGVTQSDFGFFLFFQGRPLRHQSAEKRIKPVILRVLLHLIPARSSEPSPSTKYPEPR